MENNILSKKIHGNFGFGMMRFLEENGNVDIESINEMVDTYINAGFNYFDTAHVYLNGKSETIVKDAVVKRHPREEIFITNKLSGQCFKTEEDIKPLFETQLKACGVDYFDLYLMHAMEEKLFKKYKNANAFEHALELKQQGKIMHFGISFHGTKEVLLDILTQYPQIEVVQLQLNYLDMDDVAVQGRACLEICNKFKKPVIVMEPIKGGSLIELPQKALDVIKVNLQSENPEAHAASLALRYAANLPGVCMTLSGMNDICQVKQNVQIFSNFSDLDEIEKKTIEEVVTILNSLGQIRCTKCCYCTNGCPAKIDIPSIFSCYNRNLITQKWTQDFYYQHMYSKKGPHACDCIKCGKCENICPQHLPIRKHLETCSEIFDKNL